MDQATAFTSVMAHFGTVIAAGGGGALVTLGIVSAFGSKWLDSRFSRALERSRQDHEKELERFKAEIEDLNRTRIRFRERQFNSVSDIWEALRKADLYTRSVHRPLKQYPDFATMSDQLVREYLARRELSEAQIDDLLKSGGRVKVLQKFADRVELSEAKKQVFTFRDQLLGIEPFIPAPIFDGLLDYAKRLLEALVAVESSIDFDFNAGREKARLKLDLEDKEELKKLTASIRSLVGS